MAGVSSRSTPRSYWAALIGLSAIWGSSYLFISLALEGVGPFMLVFLRVGLAALVLLPLLLRMRATLAGRWHRVFLIALPQVAVPFVLISAGERRIDSGLAAILVATMPLWIVALMPVLGLGRPTVRAIGGTLVGLVGVVLLFGGVGTGGAVDPVGAGMVVAAALCYAIGSTLVRRWMVGVHPVAVTASVMSAATLLLTPFAAFDVPDTWPGGMSIGALLALALVCTAAAFVLYNRLIAEAGPQRASLIGYLAPVFAVAYGAALLDEPLGVGTFAGLGLILFGSWLCGKRRVNDDSKIDTAVGNKAGSVARPIG